MEINLYDCLFVDVITTGNLKKKFKSKKFSHLIIKIMIILNEINCFRSILIDSENM